jgi:hypothetical protein
MSEEVAEELFKALHLLRKDFMLAIDTLNTNITALKDAVTAAKGRVPTGGATEAQVQTAADEVAAITADVATIAPAA